MGDGCCQLLEIYYNIVNYNNYSPAQNNYYKAIAVAKSLGIAKGYDDKFMPNAGITREDAMVLVDRALTIEGKKWQ